jgi:hypothetical protein
MKTYLKLYYNTNFDNIYFVLNDAVYRLPKNEQDIANHRKPFRDGGYSGKAFFDSKVGAIKTFFDKNNLIMQWGFEPMGEL